MCYPIESSSIKLKILAPNYSLPLFYLIPMPVVATFHFDYIIMLFTKIKSQLPHFMTSRLHINDYHAVLCRFQNYSISHRKLNYA